MSKIVFSSICTNGKMKRVSKEINLKPNVSVFFRDSKLINFSKIGLNSDLKSFLSSSSKLAWLSCLRSLSLKSFSSKIVKDFKA